jgi:uncharacterized membrane protein YsdA (DUF1294 family)
MTQWARFGWVAFLAAAAGALALWAYAGLPPLPAWLVAVNGVAFLTYGYDKWIAARPRALRVPEAVLLGLALLGGSPGAFVGMRLFHHKTAKASFFTRFIGIVVLQVLLVVAWLIWGR